VPGRASKKRLRFFASGRLEEDGHFSGGFANNYNDLS
jgi:hypothetical protein